MADSLGKTFKQECSEWHLKGTENGTLGAPDREGAMKFAAYLDGFHFLTPQLQLLAVMQSRKIDAEFINALVDVVGKEKATEIARGIHAKYMKPGTRTQLDVHKEIDEITGSAPDAVS